MTPVYSPVIPKVCTETSCTASCWRNAKVTVVECCCRESRLQGEPEGKKPVSSEKMFGYWKQLTQVFFQSFYVALGLPTYTGSRHWRVYSFFNWKGHSHLFLFRTSKVVRAMQLTVSNSKESIRYVRTFCSRKKALRTRPESMVTVGKLYHLRSFHFIFGLMYMEKTKGGCRQNKKQEVDVPLIMNSMKDIPSLACLAIIKKARCSDKINMSKAHNSRVIKNCRSDMTRYKPGPTLNFLSYPFCFSCQYTSCSETITAFLSRQ